MSSPNPHCGRGDVYMKFAHGKFSHGNDAFIHLDAGPGGDCDLKPSSSVELKTLPLPMIVDLPKPLPRTPADALPFASDAPAAAASAQKRVCISQSGTYYSVDKSQKCSYAELNLKR